MLDFALLTALVKGRFIVDLGIGDLQDRSALTSSFERSWSHPCRARLASRERMDGGCCRQQPMRGIAVTRIMSESEEGDASDNRRQPVHTAKHLC